jgi:hypothetical protein
MYGALHETPRRHRMQFATNAHGDLRPFSLDWYQGCRYAAHGHDVPLWRKQMKKIVPFVVAAALGVGLTTAAQAHVSVGIGIGVPVAPAYPVYAAPAYYPPPPVVYAPPPVVYAPPVVVGGYYGYHGYYRGGPYYRHGYYGRGYYRH